MENTAASSLKTSYRDISDYTDKGQRTKKGNLVHETSTIAEFGEG